MKSVPANMMPPYNPWDDYCYLMSLCVSVRKGRFICNSRLRTWLRKNGRTRHNATVFHVFNNDRYLTSLQYPPCNTILYWTAMNRIICTCSIAFRTVVQFWNFTFKVAYVMNDNNKKEYISEYTEKIQSILLHAHRQHMSDAMRIIRRRKLRLYL